VVSSGPLLILIPIRRRYQGGTTLPQHFKMARFTKNPARRTTHAEVKTLVQKFFNSDSQIEPPEEQAQRLLSSGHLVQVYGEMTPEDKRKLVEKLDQVCHPGSHSSFPTAFSHRVHPDPYDRQPAKHRTPDLIRRLLQHHKATSGFHHASCRTDKA